MILLFISFFLVADIADSEIPNITGMTWAKQARAAECCRALGAESAEMLWTTAPCSLSTKEFPEKDEDEPDEVDEL